MRLKELLCKVEYELIRGNLSQNIEAVQFDSREVRQAGTLFVAVDGFETDGHRYIADAVAAGATAVIVERDVPEASAATVIRVADSRLALAEVAAALYDYPTERLQLIGITGTNGKTSTSMMLKSIYEHSGESMGCVSTLGTYIGQDVTEQRHTTPESLELQRLFRQMVDAGLRHCVMEVSSHALHLQRVAGCRLDRVVFTNLTPDHLELHQTMEDYYETKARLFEMADKHAILNGDDPYGRRLIARCRERDAEYITYGIEADADLRASDIRYSETHSDYMLRTPSGAIAIRVPLPGIINVYNSLAAIACAYADDVSLPAIQRGLAALSGIKGRFEVVHQDEELKVIVDFAHTEDGLEQALRTLRPYVRGRLIVVFGVYADRGEAGQAKRQAMGRVADRWSDLAIVTSDNSKHRTMDTFLREIRSAMGRGSHLVYPDRREAIEQAIRLSRRGDVILLAGKGHEQTQQIGSERIPFCEAEIVRICLAEQQQHAMARYANSLLT
ncbi:UDP-N-acetylmuramoyl-L-alanyl-D-glutamate--2,6-diaminopimelate ligase [Paenibacillus sp. 598K]|uniref:UDP-N-acetylmuramoyl-L-alanyl-D-glutamate--2, 6-diaminopimelate ligase n=1 Tax=Paenibacillus sp. 598K TaxID=1117987 RepID=UPI000FFA7153|nr:UDP-N-acetylmuramoyl-L-alanyl-D-glutamate--2,6-diaminopimelate ligase [Paenibacillus sp. 598K]GBF73477.1 UDP-N-acetylmuramoyl-L-alanyl-D-glutamate--2,6-diaminopimelate ligase [Paenibacillus sp. 598K]